MNRDESAFPQDVVYLMPDQTTVPQGLKGGMTLRDYFAIRAMQVLYDDRLVLDRIAESSYLLADAMLKARGQP